MNKKDRGFSLIELLVIVVIVGFIALVLFNIPNSIRLIGVSRSSSVALDIAQKAVEDLRSITYDNLVNGSTNITDSRLTSLPGSSGTILIEDCPLIICSSGELTKKATITVNWRDQAVTKKIDLTTFISEGGL